MKYGVYFPEHSVVPSSTIPSNIQSHSSVPSNGHFLPTQKKVACVDYEWDQGFFCFRVLLAHLFISFPNFAKDEGMQCHQSYLYEACNFGSPKGCSSSYLFLCADHGAEIVYIYNEKYLALLSTVCQKAT